MRRMLLLISSLLVFTFPAYAESKSPYRGDTLTADEMAAFKAMTADDAPPTKLSDIKYFSLSLWPKAPQIGLAIAAMGSSPDNFDVAVLKPKANGWEIVALTNTNNEPAVEPAEANILSGLALDPIPYRISKNNFAFGVRVSTLFNSTSTVVDNTSLHLFDLQDGQLVEILATDVDYTERDKINGHDKTSQSVIEFVSTQHDGHYDVIVKPAKGSNGKTIHYGWKDQHYSAGDAQDAFQH